MKKLLTLCLSLMLALSLCAPLAVSADGEAVISATEVTTLEFEDYTPTFADGSAHNPFSAKGQNKDFCSSLSNGDALYTASAQTQAVVYTMPVNFATAGKYKVKLRAAAATYTSPLTLALGENTFTATKDNGSIVQVDGADVVVSYSWKLYEWETTFTVATAGVQNLTLTADVKADGNDGDKVKVAYCLDSVSFEETTPKISATEETSLAVKDYTANIAYADGSAVTFNTKVDGDRTFIYRASKADQDAELTIPVKFTAPGTYQVKLVAGYNTSILGTETMSLQVGGNTFKPTDANGTELSYVGPFSIKMYEWNFKFSVEEAGVQEVKLIAKNFYRTSESRNESNFVWESISFEDVTPQVAATGETKFEVEDYKDYIAFADGSAVSYRVASADMAGDARLENFSNHDLVYYGANASKNVELTFLVNFAAPGRYQVAFSAGMQSDASPLTLQVGGTIFKPTLGNVSEDLGYKGPYNLPMMEWTYDITVGKAGMQEVKLIAESYSRASANGAYQAVFAWDYISFEKKVASNLTTILNATFEDGDTTTYKTVNDAALSKVSGGAKGSGYALQTSISKGSFDFSFSDKGAASFAFVPQGLGDCQLFADVKLVTCSTTTPTTVSFVVKDSSGNETVIPAALDTPLSTSGWTRCTASYTPKADLKTIELRIGSGKIKEIGLSSGSFLKSYSFAFLLDNFVVKQEPVLSMSDALVHDFENGWYPSWGTISSNTDVTWTNTNTYDESAGAIEVSTTQAYGAVAFPLRTVAGNTYEISAWVKVNEAPLSQKAYFIIYNPSTDGQTAQAWNQIAATTSGDFEVGKWVLCTATFEADGEGNRINNGVTESTAVLPEGTVEFRLGSGVPAEVMSSGTISYALDDFFVFPTVDNKINTEDMVINGNFSTEAAFKAAWKQAGGVGRSTVTWLQDGANGTSGAMQVQVLDDWGTGATKTSIPVEFYRDYTLTFWAKAVSNEAVGLDMYAILMYDDKTVPAAPAWKHIYPSGSATTLSSEWQQYTINFKAESYTEESSYPYLYFRAGNGTEKVSYAIDEVSVHQTGDANFGVDAYIWGNAESNSGVTLEMTYSESSKGGFLYRVMDETSNGDKLLKIGYTKASTKWISAEDLEGDNVRIEILSIDSYGKCSQIRTMRLEEINTAQEDTVTLSQDQYIWTKDLPTLSATVDYDNKTKDANILSLAAQYAADGSLISVTPTPVSVAKGEHKSWQVSQTADSAAVKAKYFVWHEDSYEPVTLAGEMEKTTKGEFIYVDAKSAASSEDGSFSAPYKTLGAARVRLSEHIAVSEEANIYVILKSGEYVDKNGAALELDADDFSNNKNVIFTSLSSDKAKISGAKHFSGADFDYDSATGIYSISVPDGTNTRQLYVNGIKATRARSEEDAIPFTNLDYAYEQSTGNSTLQNLGMTSTDTSFASYEYPTEIEMVFIENWNTLYLMPDTVTETEDGLTQFGFTAEGNKSIWEWLHTRTTASTTTKTPIYVENALELLDEEGEWYLDTHKDKLYYKPRYFENMQTADIVIPTMEKLLNVKGTPDDPASNISFKNLDFEYTTWNYPTTNRSYRIHQNGVRNGSEVGNELIEGAVELFDVKNITFDNCDFSKIGSIALKMTGAVQNCNVMGNEFYEIANNAIALGDVTTKQIVDGVDRGPMNRYPTEAKYEVTNNLIANNYIHKVATEHYSASALSVAYPKNTTIRNNELADGPYTGMHIGWGWDSIDPVATENLVIEKNYIHNFMNWRLYDGGGIYTLGKTNGTAANPNLIRQNYFEDIKNHAGVIYPDQSSSYWKVAENVIDQSKYPLYYKKENDEARMNWLHINGANTQQLWFEDNYSTTLTYRKDGTNISYEAPAYYPDASWPEAAQAIIDNAGIEKNYRSRFVFDIQDVEMPRKQEVLLGETVPFAYSLISSKGMLCDMEGVEVRASSSNPAVATATANSVTGVSAGKAWITLSVLREVDGKVEYYDEFTFYVEVH